MRNIKNEAIIRQFIFYLHELKYSKKTCEVYILNKLRIFINDKDFREIDINDLKNFFAYLKIEKKLSDVYLSSLGTELRRFFKYLRMKGINDNLMYNLVIPANRKHAEHIPFKILHIRYKNFHPRLAEIE